MSHSTENPCNRRQFLARIGAVGALAATVNPLEAFATESKTQPERPNIIFLLTDDHRADALGCMGNELIQTPEIDRMAAEGVLFENAYVSTAICMTSRATFLTGQYSRRHGIVNFGVPLTEEAVAATYPALLREAGYYTGFVGKYGVGEPRTDQFEFNRGWDGQATYMRDNGRHMTTVMSDDALEFLGDCPDDRPFCLSVSFKAPHVEDMHPRQFIPDPDLEHLYADVEIPRPPTADDKHYDALPDFIRASEGRRRWSVRFSTDAQYQAMVKDYYRLVTGVDRVVGRIRQTLEASGQADNTVIVFMGDQGFLLGDKGLSGKWLGYERSIRTPLIVFDPRLSQDKRGRRLSEMAINNDIAPTLLGLAGLPIPERMQGRSLLPLVQGERIEWRTDFLYEHLFGAHPFIPVTEGVVELDWKYLRYTQHPDYEELFDLKNDPEETTNRARDPKYAAQLERLRKRCDALAEAAK